MNVRLLHLLRLPRRRCLLDGLMWLRMDELHVLFDVVRESVKSACVVPLSVQKGKRRWYR